MKEKSNLILVPTPIGNLEDISLRAIRILKEVDLILAEDTRQTGILLKHYLIQTPMQSYHAFNEHRETPGLIKKLKEGAKIALVTDAGTPGISDPGYHLVRECIRNQIRLECLPGPTAFVPALVQSGIPADQFCFFGFPPHKKGRKTFFDALGEEKHTMIFYESSHRLLKTLQELKERLGPSRKASISRELTKKFEETLISDLFSLYEHFNAHTPKGEFVLVVEGKK